LGGDDAATGWKHRIMAGETADTPDMAVRLGKLCGNGPELWLRMQATYDAWEASKRLKREVARIPMLRQP
jgi:antitoxin HigA-1